MFVVSLLFGAQVVFCQQQKERDNLDWAIEQLSATDLIFRTQQVLNRIFSEKEKAFPYLISNFNNTRKYCSWFGSNAMHADVVTADICKKRAQAKKERGNHNRPDYRDTQVRDVCLCLLLAILKNDMYFTNICAIHYESEESLQKALTEISLLYINSLQGSNMFDSKGIEAILEKYMIVIGK